jgi:hypothetical protein
MSNMLSHGTQARREVRVGKPLETDETTRCFRGCAAAHGCRVASSVEVLAIQAIQTCSEPKVGLPPLSEHLQFKHVWSLSNHLNDILKAD